MLDAPQAPDALARPLLPDVPIDPPAEPARPIAGDALFAAAQALLPVLEAGRPLDAATLREAMTRAFGASDSEGSWVWKDAYEAAEAAVVIFMQRYGRGMRRNAGGPRRMLAMLEAVAALEPSHTRRSEEQVRLQQFSTPLPLAYAALQAAAIRPGDTVLEPSAGTGMLAVMAQCALGTSAPGNLHLNEYARVRARLLTQLFPEAVITTFNAEAIADRLRDVRPTVVLMNPPFEQIVEWLAGSLDEEDRHAFDGVVVFDEAHAMANAAGSKSERGETKPSQQGRAGLRLQNALPDARIAYVSATGATTVPGLAYAGRLGLWAAGETPFQKRIEFVSAMEAGGVAAMEVVARDLKALGLYQARALAYDGIEVDILEHPLTPEQRRIYDAYAGAFKVIHANIEEALKATGIVQGEDTLNRNAKAAALSAFEGTKQRFFGHLLTGMKCPSTIRAIEADLAAGRSSVVQLVSTGEALMERRIADVPASEWDDLNIDLTPRDAILSYLMHAFPVQLQEPFTDDGGNLLSRPARDDDGNPVVCKEAEDRRDALIEKLAALPPVPTALDQIVQHFGHEAVAEVTGRSRRVLRIVDVKGERLSLRSRPASANLAETAAFMDGEKRILVFSMAGGTGRSYHADLSCGNTERRIHYLLEPGWRADQAIQGLGRTHRTHQASAPLFRPVTTDVKGERRFIATIARRLDTLGAITRGQRDSQTAMGGSDAALFRESDNLESPYAKAALRQFYGALWHGSIEGWNLERFEKATGLKLTWEGSLKEDLPPMPRFLNRLLALPIAEQNQLFAELEARIAANIEQAIEAGSYEVGVETVTADSLVIAGRETLYEHPGTGAATELVEIVRRDKLAPLTAESALEIGERDPGPDGKPRLAVNARSKRAAVVLPAASRMLDDGGVRERVRLIRPATGETMARAELDASNWRRADEAGCPRGVREERAGSGAADGEGAAAVATGEIEHGDIDLCGDRGEGDTGIRAGGYGEDGRMAGVDRLESVERRSGRGRQRVCEGCAGRAADGVAAVAGL